MPLSPVTDYAAAAALLRGLERILLVGCSGAGKSTLARQLGTLLSLPVIHLDREFWQPGWVQPDDQWWQTRMAELLAQPRWVMDGNYSKTFEQRLQRAQAVIFLDFPRPLCIRRVLGRVLHYYGRSRPDLPETCPERIDWDFMLWIWNYRRRSRPKILALLEAHGDKCTPLILRRPQQLKQLLTVLQTSQPAACRS